MAKDKARKEKGKGKGKDADEKDGEASKEKKMSLVDPSCIFCQIALHQASARIVYEDEEFMVFHDKYPKAELHLLFIPKRHIPSLKETTDDDTHMLGKLIRLVAKIAEKMGVSDYGYKTVIHTGRGGGQEIFHLHIHLLSRRQV